VKEVITYSSGSIADTLQSNYSEKISVLDDGTIRLKVNKIKTERNGDHRVSLIRCNDSDLEWVQDVFTLCSDIANVFEGESAWDMVTPEGENLINLAYTREYINEEGQECLKPKCFGRFI